MINNNTKKTSTTPRTLDNKSPTLPLTTDKNTNKSKKTNLQQLFSLLSILNVHSSFLDHSLLSRLQPCGWLCLTFCWFLPKYLFLVAPVEHSQDQGKRPVLVISLIHNILPRLRHFPEEIFVNHICTRWEGCVYCLHLYISWMMVMSGYSEPSLRMR